MELPDFYRTYLSTLKERLEREGFCESDFEDISSNELIFDSSKVEAINVEMRSFKAIWLPMQVEPSFWPDDWLIIGGSGNGDYFCISKSGSFSGVYCFEHESLQFVSYASSLDDFYAKTMVIMRSRRSGNA